MRPFVDDYDAGRVVVPTVPGAPLPPGIPVGGGPLPAPPPISEACNTYLAGLSLASDVRENVVNSTLGSIGVAAFYEELPPNPLQSEMLIRIGELVGRDRVFPDVGERCAGDLRPSPGEAAARPCSFVVAELIDRTEVEWAMAFAGLPTSPAIAPEDLAEGANAAIGAELDRVVDVLRQAGACDGEMSPATRAFESGVANGTRALEILVPEVTGCGAEQLVQLALRDALASADEAIASAQCAPPPDEDPGHAARRAQSDQELRNGYVEGVRRAAADLTLRARYACICGPG